MCVTCLFGKIAQGFMDGEYVLDVLDPHIILTDGLNLNNYKNMEVKYNKLNSSPNFPTILVAWTYDNKLWIDSRIVDDMQWRQYAVKCSPDKSFKIQSGTLSTIEFVYDDSLSSELGITSYCTQLGNIDWLNVDDQFWECVPDVVKRFMCITVPKLHVK